MGLEKGDGRTLACYRNKAGMLSRISLWSISSIALQVGRSDFQVSIESRDEEKPPTLTRRNPYHILIFSHLNLTSQSEPISPLQPDLVEAGPSIHIDVSHALRGSPEPTEALSHSDLVEADR